MKTCLKCQTAKHPDSFYTSKQTKDGRRPYCKQCEAEKRAQAAPYTYEYNKGYYAGHKEELNAKSTARLKENPEKMRKYQQDFRRKRRVDHPELDMLVRCRTRSKHLNVPFDLQVEDIHIPPRCPVLGIPLIRRTDGQKGPLPESPSIDRIHPERGYVRGNIRVVSNRANTLKNNATVEELELVLADLRALHATQTA